VAFREHPILLQGLHYMIAFLGWLFDMTSVARRLGSLFLIVFLTFNAEGQNNNSTINNSGSPAADPAQIIHFLSNMITWYHQLPMEQHLATQPSDLAFFQENRHIADQVVQLSFDYARSQAQLLHSRKAASQTAANPSQYQRLLQAEQKADQDLQDTQLELQVTRAKLSGASPVRKKTVAAQAAELESEIGLLQARRDALDTMLEFVSTSTSGQAGLRAQIEELARSVPASLSHPSGATAASPTAEPSPATNTAEPKKAQPSGIWGLAADLLNLSGKMHTLNDQISATGELNEDLKNLRKPALDYLRALVKQGDQLFAAADTASPNQLAQETQQLDALTAQFKQTSAQLLPLSKISVLLDVYGRTLSNWREAVKADAHDEGRQLLLRLAVLLALIGIVIVIGEIWRRTTFRYVHDVRRRYQFLLLRRVVMWVAIGLIILLTFATQLGSAVTFAGLITAGVAVALQNVIVSVVAYFFLIGKYGIRVGDRVQISGVTGEVVDIGLVRIHVMELGGPGDSQPTGRIVAFSNSIVFQPTAGIFKQIPGTNFIWHELKLTLASETDYSAAKQRITQAINAALEEYRENIEAQRQGLEKNLTSVSLAELRAKVRLHYTSSGIEATVRFPVELQKASEIDDHVMKEIMAALEQEPKMRLMGAEMPALKVGD
jgi:small-conductance mechanosensitive channel